jgi:predicted metal-dependent hydrolase
VHIDQIIRSKRKTIQILVTYEGKLIVRAPLRTSQAKIKAAVASKEAWILDKQAQFKILYPPRPARNYRSGEEFLFLGQEYTLKIVTNQKEALVFQDGFSLSKSYQKQAPIVLENWYRHQARRYLTREVERLSLKYGFNNPKIRITSAQTRFGSCSSSGYLNFPWRLIMAPPEAIEYVVTHELAHFKVQGHSKKFWELVGELLPGYQKPKAWLKKYGYTLTL